MTSFCRARCPSFYIQLSLIFFLSFSLFISFLLFSSQVSGKTLVHEFHISYRHTEWYFLFSPTRNSPCFGRSFACQNYKLKPVLNHEWSGMVETHSLYCYVGEKKYPTVESLTWPLSSHNCSKNYSKTETMIIIILRIGRRKQDSVMR